MAGTLYEPMLVQGVVTGGANQTHTVVRAIEIYDATVFATATQAGGTITITTAAGAATDGIACATDGAVDRAATLDNANKLAAAGSTLTFTVAGAATAGVATVHCFVTGSGTALA